MQPRLRQQSESAREKRDGGENRVPFAVRHVQRRPAAPERRVVHRWQVVEDEGSRVHHFDRAPGVDEARAWCLEQVSRENDERRPHSLPRREERLTGDGRESVLRIEEARVAGKKVREPRVDRGAHLGE